MIGRHPRDLPSSEGQPAMQHSGWLVRRRFSTRSLPSLEKLQECLTASRQTVAFYSSGTCARTDAALLELSKP